MKIDETSTASLSRPPPLPRRSSTRPSTPFSSCSLISARSAPWAPSLKVVNSITPKSRPPRETVRPSAAGTSIFSRLRSSVRVRPVSGSPTSSFTRVPAGPLMRPVATWLGTPAIDLPFTSTTSSPGLMPARAAGESSKALEHLQPAAVLLHAQAHALQLARHGLAELARLRRGEVLRELVAQPVHDALERALVDLRRLHRLVEAVLDRVDQLGAQRAVVVHEGVAQRPGQRLGVPAPPDAGSRSTMAPAITAAVFPNEVIGKLDCGRPSRLLRTRAAPGGPAQG